MEMPGRRSNYSLLSQVDDEQYGAGGGGVAGVAGASFYETVPVSGEGKGNNNNNKGKVERGFDWESMGGDHRGNNNNNNNNNNQQVNRIGNMYPSSIGLQRQSSGSSYGESSLSGEYYAPTLSASAANEIDAFGYLHDDVFKIGGGGEFRSKGVDGGGGGGTGGSSSGKSWAQQTEESYQLQLALALRLSSDATCADDPNFLDPMPDESAIRSGLSNSAEAVSHRFWVRSLFCSWIFASCFEYAIAIACKFTFVIVEYTEKTLNLSYKITRLVLCLELNTFHYGWFESRKLVQSYSECFNLFPQGRSRLLIIRRSRPSGFGIGHSKYINAS